ncbi:MAG: hypothetical protein U9N40_00770 [Euryarchaeota archaeon]|nr:hypothetical protein [Euryarchaeota archaeon]
MDVILLVSMAIPFASATGIPLPDNYSLYIETANSPRFEGYNQGDN